MNMFRAAFLPILFSLTLFMSATLIFIVQPMVAKMILPLLGGTPAVWNTCMMFFQALLLGGYAYAHVSSSRLLVGKQVMLHAALLLLACIVLPVAISRHWIPAGEANPIGVVLILLLFSVGLPFFVLSSTAPLMQRWFVWTGHPSASDPYFLYSASNAGSMLALISYPAIIEPLFSLHQQSSHWSIGYIVLIVFILGCACFTWRSARLCHAAAGVSTAESVPAYCVSDAPPPARSQQLRWVALAFVPSSLMLGVTTFLSTDVAAIPLFWVIPLSLYLLTFILVFANIPQPVNRLMLRLFPIAVIVLLFINVPLTKPAMWIAILFNLATFFIVAMVCHGELARTRPPAQFLTGFYLWMSVGGVLGGIFNAVFAPLVFRSVVEYPLVLALAALLIFRGAQSLQPSASPRLSGVLDVLLPLLLGGLTFWLTVEWPLHGLVVSNLAKTLNISHTVMTYAIPAVLCYAMLFMKRPRRFGLGVSAVAVALILSHGWDQKIIHQERSFFGVVKVSEDVEGGYRLLVHGTTQHGRQSLDPALRDEPASYYHRTGPLGQVFKEFSGKKRKVHIALIGLGIGTIASYGEKGQRFTFYEIDPSVRRVATDPALFTYLENCKAQWSIVMGDARLKLEEAAVGAYGLIVLDAFSSDSIPVHLVTREAFALYFSKLDKSGILAVHISNKYLDLSPVLGRLAEDAGLVGYIQDDKEDESIGKYHSTWVLLARDKKHLGALPADERWKALKADKGGPVWTDDYSNILKVFIWK
ncbi:MAG TPA: fused MFS/spermidine synthase [Dissulfurispiraceae bacterium]|nr:fused MFS/spermidine synthase [Dissulfurispiraceae bacterium]